MVRLSELTLEDLGLLMAYSHGVNLKTEDERKAAKKGGARGETRKGSTEGLKALMPGAFQQRERKRRK